MSAALLREAADQIREDAPGLEDYHPWHPAVAFAVADWLEKCAGFLDRGLVGAYHEHHALIVARAYLGGDQ